MTEMRDNMEFSEKIIANELLIGGAAIALERGMHRVEDVTSVHEGDEAMTSSWRGINSGKVWVMYGEMSTARYKYFYLNDELLFEEQYNRVENGWATEPTNTTAKLAAGTILYTK